MAISTGPSIMRHACLALSGLVFLWHLYVGRYGSAWAVPFIGTGVLPGVAITSSSLAAVEVEGIISQQHAEVSSIEGGHGQSVFHPISYSDCRTPLVVDGKIVSCKGGQDGNRSASHRIAGSSSGTGMGPVLNQSFSVEISTDFFFRRTIACHQHAKKATEAAPEAETPSVNAEIEKGNVASTKYTNSQGNKNLSDDPHFIRIFGRWVPNSSGLQLLLDPDVNNSPLRRLDATAANTEEVQQLRPSEVSLQPKEGLSAPEGGDASNPFKGRYPFLYWRQAMPSLSIQHACIALIKLPAEEGNRSFSSTETSTAHIPESCEEAQRLLSQEPPSEPFWVSCGPELELSKLSRFITFPVSQEKMYTVLAALEYSVEIWKEPREVELPTSSDDNPQEANKEDQGAFKGEAPSETTQYEKLSASSEALSTPAPRDVEARRLSAQQQEDPLAQPPKWRVGVCLLSGPQGAAKDQPTERTAGVAKVQAGAQNGVATSAQEGGTAGKEDTNKHFSGNAQEEQKAEAKQVEDAHDQFTFSDATLVGEVKFHVPPVVTSHPKDDDKNELPDTIQIRHFIDAGWMYIREVQGVNLTRFNRLALKESPSGPGRPCVGFWEEHSVLSVAPEAHEWNKADQETLKFVFSSSLKDSVQNKEAFYHSVREGHATSKIYVCFYSNDEQPYGLFLGEVQFVIDSADARLLVFLILFVFLAIPITCAVAISFHVYKHRHLRERLQRLVLVQQRDAVEQLLMRELGLTAEGPDDPDDDDDEEEAHV